ncbi:MAG TPA: LacI family DNA-binding transcriptional regulator, partial [Steroidobacteraceae bacterium]|nr:LacI family DNA-binding transcriptional regulator [Steroidobacteraceae bacterium]
GSAVTIHEVARQAGVSPMTVSRVMNGRTNVRGATRDIVMRAVRDLNYTPNAAARLLAGAEGTRVALIYSNPSTAYLSELLVGALDGASRTAAQLVLDRWDSLKPAAERAAARKLVDAVSGVILPPPLCESKVIVSELTSAGIPVIAVATGRFSNDFSCVRVDDYQATCEITQHLLEHGHTRIGFIKGHPNQTASARRFAGFQSALQQAEVPLNEDFVQQGYFTYRSGLEAAEKLLNRKRPPTAIVASNDDMAAAAISVAHRRGLDVPRDLSVVGFDDTSIATTLWPELTTIRQPIAAMAGAAIDLLLQAIRNRKEGKPVLAVDHVVEHTLVKRDSVAAPRKN